MYSDMFPGCCGIGIVYDVDEDDHWMSKDDFVRELKENEFTQLEERVGLLLITLAGYQMRKYKPLLIKAGYKVLGKSFRNPRHNSRITMFYKKPKYGPDIG